MLQRRGQGYQANVSWYMCSFENSRDRMSEACHADPLEQNRHRTIKI